MSITGKKKKKKDKIQIRATTTSGVVCGVPFTIAPLIGTESQRLFAWSPPRNCQSAKGGMIWWEGSLLRKAELNQFVFLNFQTFDSLLF